MVRIHQGITQIALAFLSAMLTLDLRPLNIEVHFAAVVSFVIWSVSGRWVVDSAHGAHSGVHWHLKEMDLEGHIGLALR